MYDYVFITHLPAFYKVNLYNSLARTMKVYVIFIAEKTAETRSSDFSNLGNNISFDYEFLSMGSFQKRSKIQSIFKLSRLLRELTYKRIVVGGWDLPEFWYIIFTQQRAKNSLALESTITESATTKVKSLIKKVFLSRIGRVFASGKLQIQLLKQLSYDREIILTNGVGIINKPKSIGISKPKVYAKRFLFIGRLVEEKNLSFLIKTFNSLPEHHLTIVGDGPLKLDLISQSAENISYLQSVANVELSNVFAKFDIFILPSSSEPWGLVIEEALFFGLPVFISNNCGASELIIDGVNGYKFDVDNQDELKEIIKNLTIEKHRFLLESMTAKVIESKDIRQVKSYEF